MDYVSRDTARVVAIGLVAIVAIAMGAATIQSTVAFGTGDTGPMDPLESPEPEQDEVSNDSVDQSNGSANMEEGGDSSGLVAGLTTCVRPLAAWYGGLLYFGAFAAVLVALNRRYSTGATMLGMYALAPVVLTAYFFSTDCATTMEDTQSDSSVVESVGDAAGSGLVSTDVSPLLVGGVFGVALVATAVLLYRASGDQSVEIAANVEDAGTDQPDVSDLAAAAAAAADRLEEHNADVDNEVYRAWQDMTALLNVPKPASSTPGEFAEAAIEAGLDEDDVQQLTQLFEEVRYGERDAAAREERAIDVFRSIEDAYGTNGDAAANGGETDGR